MNRGITKALLILSYALTLVLMAVFHSNRIAMFFIAALGIAAGLVLIHLLRCPKCGRSQGKAWLFSAYCPHCGEPLD